MNIFYTSVFKWTLILIFHSCPILEPCLGLSENFPHVVTLTRLGLHMPPLPLLNVTDWAIGTVIVLRIRSKGVIFFDFVEQYRNHLGYFLGIRAHNEVIGTKKHASTDLFWDKIGITHKVDPYVFRVYAHKWKSRIVYYKPVLVQGSQINKYGTQIPV